ncbi:MAG: L-2-amino-thiazoline-4-carboxylic acid hydrolase [Candidatus Ranarchaeia archaeon]
MSPFKPNPLLKRALSSGPYMFALIAIPFIKKYGEEAKKLLADIMYREGYKKGQRLRAKAKDPNDLLEFERLLIEDYNAQGFNTPGFNDPARHWIIKTKTKCSYDLCQAGGCEEGIPEVWQEMGLDAETVRMLGEIHCEPYDQGVRKGFNPKIKLVFKKLVTRGDPYCEWFEELED